GSHDDYEEVESSVDPNSALNDPRKRNVFSYVVFQFNRAFYALLTWYEGAVWNCLKRPGLVVGACSLIFVVSLAIYPLMGKAFFPRTDPGQFVINVKVPAGTRIELTNEYVAKMEQDIRGIVTPHDLNIIVSNIGITPDLSAIYTSNS